MPVSRVGVHLSRNGPQPIYAALDHFASHVPISRLTLLLFGILLPSLRLSKYDRGQVSHTHDSRHHSIGNFIPSLNTSELESKTAVDHAKKDDQSSFPDMQVRHAPCVQN